MTGPHERFYIGIDVGGTKIQASLVSETGTVCGVVRGATPRDCGPELTIDGIEHSARKLLEEQSRPLSDISAIGIAIPGVVEQETGNIVITPNMNLGGVPLGAIMSERFDIPVVIGNDCNLGTLGECWLGSARNSNSCVGIFVGTGIGSGIVVKGELFRGAAQSTGEIGHMVSQIPGQDWRGAFHMKGDHRKDIPQLPLCGCGNRGCFETLAGRAAIERFIREGIEAGVKSDIVDICEGNLDVIRSGAIAKALKAEDKLVTAIIRYASGVIGYTCLSVRHLLDPEVIVLGGGLMEACHKYMMPIIEEIISNDKLTAAPSARRILLSSLGDDAVVLGAVALAQTLIGRSPFDRKNSAIPRYPNLKWLSEGKIMVDLVSVEKDFLIRSNGQYELRSKRPKDDPEGFRLKDVENASNGGLEELIFASDAVGEVSLSAKCRDYLALRGIPYKILPIKDAIHAFNEATTRRAAIFNQGR